MLGTRLPANFSFARMVAVASNPSISGICMSINTAVSNWEGCSKWTGDWP
jgi:hypothetical protein